MSSARNARTAQAWTSPDLDSEAEAATATPQSAGRLRLAFEEPQRSVAPGQAAVLYDDGDPDVVLGGGTICRGDDGNAPGAAGAGSVGSRHD